MQSGRKKGTNTMETPSSQRLVAVAEERMRELSRLRVAVLHGGPGAEREVSLESGRQVHQALRRDGKDVALLDVRGPADIEKLDADVAVVMLHGEFGEDGAMQALLEARGMAFTGSDARACALAMDKHAAKQRLAEAGVRVAAWGLARSENPGEIDDALRAAGGAFPLVVKPNARGSSVGVTLARDATALADAVRSALAFDPGGAMVEAYVDGREFTAGWLGGVSLPLVELKADAEFYDYDAKYISDRTRYLCPAPVDPRTTADWQKMAARVVEVLGARDLARVDFMADSESPEGAVVLEINTAPGFTAHSLLPKAAKAAGLDLAELCWRLVDMAAARRQ